MTLDNNLFEDEDEKEIEDIGCTVRSDFVPLFEGAHNPNHDIFVTPTQGGADEDDQWNGSIGDAVMEHVTKMSHRLMEMEHYVHMPNGNIFRVENNVATPDEEGGRAIKNEIQKLIDSQDIYCHDLSKITYSPGFRHWEAAQASYRTSARAPLRLTTLEDKKAVIQFLREEIEQVKLDKVERQDIMEQSRIPYSEWEFNPQMANAIDMPSTPNSLYIYAGNSKDLFYDDMPEDHPDKAFMVKLLTTANSIEWDDFDEKTAEYFEKKIYDYQWNHIFAADRLAYAFSMISYSEAQPERIIKQALVDIDADWGSEIKVRAVGIFEEDIIIQEMNKLEIRLKDNAESGRVSWGDIGKFGQHLFRTFGKRMTTAHWNRYKALKSRYSPTVLVGKIDINKANMNELRSIFTTRFKNELETIQFSEVPADMKRETQIRSEIDKLASFVFFNRPFFSVEDLAEKKIIRVEDLGYNENTVVFVSMIKKCYEDGLKTRSTLPLSKIAQQIVNTQQNKPKMLSNQEWLSVWQVYRVCKGNLTVSLTGIVDNKTL